MEQFINLDMIEESTSLDSPSYTPTTPTTPNSMMNSSLPVQIQGEQQHLTTNNNDNGLSFNEVFRQYLAPEGGKQIQLPPLPLAPLPNVVDDHPFAFNNHLENASSSLLYNSSDSFSPSVFMPSTIPGSPFSDDSGGSNGRRLGSLSPLSIGELELELSSNGLVSSISNNSMEGELDCEMGNDNWAIDPSFFGGGQQQHNRLGSMELPPLPDLPLFSQPQQPIKLEETLVDFGTSRQRSISTVQEGQNDEEEQEEEEEEEEEEDEEMGEGLDSDDSEAATTTTTKSRSTINNNNKKSKSTPLGNKRVQKLAKTSVAGFATTTLHATSARSTLPPVPEWTDKPDPESYKKLNSKEKRQLRNKISARNFRHRRKEYITTLEEEISSRDTIISQLRDEVIVMKSENKSLKSEVGLLKQKWDEMLSKMTSFSVPSSTTTTTSSVGLSSSLKSIAGNSSSTGLATTTTFNEDWPLDSTAIAPPIVKVNRTRGSNGIAKPSVNKDINPGSIRSGGGGSNNNNWATNGMGTTNHMSVHTTLLPEFSLGLNPKPLAYQRQSFNPSINALNASQLSQLPSLTSHLRNGFIPTPPSSSSPTTPPANSRNTFDNFFESNPFWLKPENVEEYRGQLYGKVAHNLAGAVAQAKSEVKNATTSSTSTIPTGFRPSFFTTTSSSSSTPTRSNLASSSSTILLSGKESRDTYTSPSELLTYQSPRTASELHQREQELALAAQTTLVASLAATTLFNRLAGCFVEAFAGETLTGGGGGMSREKVRSVLEGRSRVTIVEIEPTSSSSGEMNSLGQSLSSLNLTSPPPTTGTPSTTSATTIPIPTLATTGFSGSVCSRWGLSCKKEE